MTLLFWLLHFASACSVRLWKSDSPKHSLSGSSLLLHPILLITHWQQILKKTMDNSWKEMKAALDDLLESGLHSDVTLVVDGKDYKAHKNILSIRSRVFKAMFRYKNTKEEQEGRVVIEDVPKEEFEAFLKYLYLCEIPKTELVGEKLLMLADKVCFIIWNC